ncbi:MAG: extracellular solute-binding protein [Clostridiales bacterium]|nr:extracellular solute-binding protein [Clostridiales bacterium]
MRRILILLPAVMLLAAMLPAAMPPMAALAEGVTLYTVSSFAGADASAAAYVELLKAFEESTGHVVVDSSASSDETWKTSVLYDFAAGNEPDILFFFAASADSAPILSRVVPIDEINAAYPDLMLPENASVAETDGRVYAIPVRPFWEALFVNTDLFERYGVALPDTWDKLETAIRRFTEEGVVPISVSLSDIPHYLVEMSILVCSSPEEYAARPASLEEVPASWYEGMALIRRLYQLGAFADNASATTEEMSSQLFRTKKAAMQIDGSWFANSIPQESMDTTIVMPMPAYAEDADPQAFVGGTSMGFYLTRRAWEDPARRDAAVQLLAWLTGKDSVRALGGMELTGALLESSYALLEHSGSMYRPLQDDMNRLARETWLLNCVPAVAEGSMTPEECWQTVMALQAFEE